MTRTAARRLRLASSLAVAGSLLVTGVSTAATQGISRAVGPFTSVTFGGDLLGAHEPSLLLDPSDPSKVSVFAIRGVYQGVVNQTTEGNDIQWFSTDGGRHFGPHRIFGGPHGGGDVDAEIGNHHEIYTVDLAVAGSELCTASSQNAPFVSLTGGACGADPQSRSNLEQDRPWLTRDGQRFFVTYRDFGAGLPFMEYSTDHLRGLQQCGAVLPPGSPAFQNTLTDRANIYLAKPIVDRAGNIIVGMTETLPTSFTQANGDGSTTPPNVGAQYVSVSTDHCKSFTSYPVLVNPADDLARQFSQLAVDQAGTVYLGLAGRIPSISKDVAAYLFTSRDHGKTWSSPRRVSSLQDGSVEYPALAAGRAGQVAMGWYASPSHDEATATWSYKIALSSHEGASPSYATAASGLHRGSMRGGRLGDYTSMVWDPKADRVIAAFAKDQGFDENQPVQYVVARQNISWPSR